MLVKIASQNVMEYRGNAVGVVLKDTVAEKIGPLEMDVMGHLAGIIFMLVFLTRYLDWIKPKMEN